MIRYPSYSELIFINGRILNDLDLQSGKKKVRDIDLLLAAEQRPQTTAFGEDAYPSLKEKAAALFHSITRNHPFTDGNKRTGTVAIIFFLTINGEKIVWKQESALDRIVNVAEGRTDFHNFAKWLKTEPSQSSLEPDVERDTLIIDSILDEQKWLLNELDKR